MLSEVEKWIINENRERSITHCETGKKVPSTSKTKFSLRKGIMGIYFGTIKELLKSVGKLNLEKLCHQFKNRTPRKGVRSVKYIILPHDNEDNEDGCGSPVVKVSAHCRHVKSSRPVPPKTRFVGKRCTLNLSRPEMSSRWCGVVVRIEGCHLRSRPRHLTMVQN
ncbi:uncharacterized protein TNCV_966261 [Trichonephila clavipes]|nr:uncharacterized protein TNCV_966261 [Trichonephila clavipes]